MKKLYIPFGKPDIRTEDYNRLKIQLEVVG